MLRFLQSLLFFGFQLKTFAKTMCNEDYYGNCIKEGCTSWFDGNHTCDIIYDDDQLVNMTCKDMLCVGDSEPVCIDPGYHLNDMCELVPNSYGCLLLLPLFFAIRFAGFMITSIYCAPQQKFSTKLTDINEDMGTTCLTCWCPCITFGEIFQDIYDVPTILGCLLYTFCGSFRCCLSVLNRWGLRKKYNIDGERDKDFCLDICIHWWAHPCALCQERRELEIYRRSDIESPIMMNRAIFPQRTHQSEQSGPTILVMASNVEKPIVINGTLLEDQNNKHT